MRFAVAIAAVFALAGCDRVFGLFDVHGDEADAAHALDAALAPTEADDATTSLCPATFTLTLPRAREA